MLKFSEDIIQEAIDIDATFNSTERKRALQLANLPIHSKWDEYDIETVISKALVKHPTKQLIEAIFKVDAENFQKYLNDL